MENVKNSEQLTDSQLINAYASLRKSLGHAPTVDKFMSFTKEELGIAASKKRMCSIKTQFEEQLTSAVPEIDPGLETVIKGAILKFTNAKVAELTSSLEKSFRSLQKDHTNLAVELEQQEEANRGHVKLVAQLTTQLETTKVLLTERDNQVEALRLELLDRETSAAAVFSTQIEQKIQENLLLREQLDRAQAEYVQKLELFASASQQPK